MMTGVLSHLRMAHARSDVRASGAVIVWFGPDPALPGPPFQGLPPLEQQSIAASAKSPGRDEIMDALSAHRCWSSNQIRHGTREGEQEVTARDTTIKRR